MQINWAFGVVVLILIYFSVKGFQRGLLRVVFSLVSIILTLMIVSVMTPYVSDFLIDNTSWYEQIRTKCVNAVNDTIEDQVQDTAEGQQQALENSGISIPENAQNKLISSTNEVVDGILESTGLSDTLGEALATLIFRIIVFLITFILVFLVIHVIFHLLNTVAKLPVIRTVNHGAGLVAGFLQGLVAVWMIFLLVSVLSSTSLGGLVAQAIQENTVTAELYNHNLILYLIMGFL